MNKALFISVKPEFAEKIFNGQKAIELRKSAPGVENGDMVIIYSSSPVMAIIGTATIKEIISTTPSKMWREHSAKLGIDKKRYSEYYEGKEVAVGIVLKGKEKLPNPISLREFKKKFSRFQPPQTFRYIDKEYFEKNFLK